MSGSEVIGPHADSGSRREVGQRVFDVTVAGVAMVLLSPIYLFIALAILIESGRPVIFVQTRLGRHGVPFRMYKFRKFHEGSGKPGLPLTLENDDRMTRVGRVLRATKLDELPQLINIILGHMSIVGPRPESLNFSDCFKGRFNQVLDHKPGLVGPSQVMFRDEGVLFSQAEEPERFYRDVVFPFKAEMDLEYFNRRTLAGDVAWILRSIVAIAGIDKALRSRQVESKVLKADIQQEPQR